MIDVIFRWVLMFLASAFITALTISLSGLPVEMVVYEHQSIVVAILALAWTIQDRNKHDDC